MNLADLDTNERIALTGLVKVVAFMDGKISPDEKEVVQQLVAAFGAESYQQHLTAFEARFPDKAEFRRFLETIDRQDARELIYGTVLTEAAADAIEGEESELLSWLAEAWGIEVTVVGDEQG